MIQGSKNNRSYLLRKSESLPHLRKPSILLSFCSSSSSLASSVTFKMFVDVFTTPNYSHLNYKVICYILEAEEAQTFHYFFCAIF